MPVTHADIVGTLRSHPSTPVHGYEHHTGGGIVLVRVDVTPDATRPSDDDPYLLIAVGADYGHPEGTVEIGFYPDWEAEGPWPDGRMHVVPLARLHDEVALGADLLCQTVWAAQFDALSRAAFTPAPREEQ